MFMRLRRMCIPTILVVGMAASLSAQDLDAQKAALDVIRETAKDICYTVEQKGQKSETQLTGDVQAKVNSALAKVVDLGVKGSGSIGNEDYQGVTQEALASALKSSGECRLKVFERLVDKMLPVAHRDSVSPPSLPANALPIAPEKSPGAVGIQAGNTAQFIGNGRWDWTIFVRGSPEEISQIRCVVYHLHPTFPNPDQQVCDPGPDPAHAFPLSSNGWGTFTVGIDIIGKDGSVRRLSHPLKFSALMPGPGLVARP
jgi:pYEATS domain-containing protein involved in immunity